jgi:hypothetical protein
LGTVARSVVTCICVAVIGLAYVWQKNQIYKLGDELKKREAAFAAAEKRNTMLAAQLAQLKSPSFLEARSQQYNLGLVAPRETQMVRLYEPGAEWDARVLPVVAQAQKQARNSPAKVVAQR